MNFRWQWADSEKGPIANERAVERFWHPKRSRCCAEGKLGCARLEPETPIIPVSEFYERERFTPQKE